ncbi:MAG: hypothetical protein CMJ25_06260 [Phycisphaerae bacterium]|nr:hypothetical protein [Phycisphaerae bacterium]
MVRRVFRLTRALYCWFRGGCEVSLTADQRLSICKKCTHYTSGRCSICGCILKYKTKMETEECPINKW